MCVDWLGPWTVFEIRCYQGDRWKYICGCCVGGASVLCAGVPVQQQKTVNVQPGLAAGGLVLGWARQHGALSSWQHANMHAVGGDNVL